MPTSATHSISQPVENGPLVHAWDLGVPMEPDVWKQVKHLASVPGVERIAIMPDAHIGKGACVGSAILTRDIVIPAAVGVDIGCGMIAAPLALRRSDLSDLPLVRAEIEQRIPIGRTNNGQAGDRGAWGNVPQTVAAVWHEHLADGYQAMTRKWPELAHPFPVNPLGALGTGNHFVEVCVELHDGIADPRLWIMLHSGSRGIGNKIGTFFTRCAQAEVKRAGIQLPDPELGFLSTRTELADDYTRFANWAQGYAWQSRLLMFRHVLEAIGTVLRRSAHELVVADETTHCHHNYIAAEEHFGRPGLLTRKGAVNADDGVMGIIPGSMGARSYITRGLGNPDALKTSSHGAGRVMSRNVARKTISMEQHLAALRDVECRTDIDVIDESPTAYKPIEAVMAAQADLTKPVHALKQIIVVKG
ncbi:MAG: RtcB family protein [Chloroflexota bacterium]|nr:RtcB family protein [Chloroflexota bacterium]